MNGWLAEFSIVRISPCGPVEAAENFIEQSNRMIVWNSFFEAGWDQDDLISAAWRSLPAASINRFLRHLPWSVLSVGLLGVDWRESSIIHPVVVAARKRLLTKSTACQGRRDCDKAAENMIINP